MKNNNDIIIFEPQLIEEWDYESSVDKVKGYFLRWGTLTQDILNELATARENLSQKRCKCNVSQTWTSYCEDIGVDRATVHRWLARHTNPELPPHVSRATGENEWDTPLDIIEAARTVMGGIDVDPASSERANKYIKAKIFFTEKTNGLDKPWPGRIWLNPPYAQPLVSIFAETVTRKYESGEIQQACILVNNATETGWFQRMLCEASAVCFPLGRIKFLDKKSEPIGAPLQGQAIIYFGKNFLRFYEIFADKGIVLDGPGKDTK